LFINSIAGETQNVYMAIVLVTRRSLILKIDG